MNRTALWALVGAGFISCLSFDPPRVACAAAADCPSPGVCAANGFCVGYGGEPDGGSAGGAATAGGAGTAGGGAAGGMTAGGMTAGGMTAGGTTAGGSAGGSSAGGGGGDAGSYCARLNPPPVFCLDFERADALAAFTGGVTQDTATATHDGGVWIIDVPATMTASTHATGRVTFPGRTELVRVIELDVLVEALPPQHISPLSFVDPPSGYTNLLISSGRVFICNAGAASGTGDCNGSSSAPLPLGQWCHLKMVLDFDAGRASLVTTVDGGTVLPQCSIPDAGLTLPAPAGAPDLRWGGVFPEIGSGRMGPTRYRLDNLVFDLR